MTILYFIFGMLSIQIILPALDSILNLFITWIEKKKKDIIENINTEDIQPIGFSLKDNEEEDE